MVVNIKKDILNQESKKNQTFDFKKRRLPNYSLGILKFQPNFVFSAIYNRQCEGHKKVTDEIVVCLISTGVTAFHKLHYHTFPTHHLEVTGCPSSQIL